MHLAHAFRAAGLLPLVLAAAPASADPPGEPLPFAVGPGATQRTGPSFPWRPLLHGAQPRAGSEVRCAAGCSTKLPAGGFATADPGTILQALRPDFVHVDKGAAPMRAARIGLREGSLHVTSGRAARHPFAIQAPGATILVRGGSARVTAGAGGVVVSAIDAPVMIERGARVLVLPAGRALELGPGEPGPPRALPAAPAWTAVTFGRAPIELSWNGEPTPVGSALQPVDGAGRYRIQIARDPTFTTVLETVITPPGQTWFSTSPLAPGSYFARAFAVGEGNLEGAPSASLTLMVARAALPPGGTVDPARRRVILAGTAGIRLLDARGLEVAVDRRTFGPQPIQLGLEGKPMRHVWLRLHDDPAAEAPLILERRALRADVEFSPRLPVYPVDSVTIQVTLTDPGGQADLRALRPALHVALDLEGLPVSWSQRGPTWIGVIDARSLRANSALRVTADDDFGAPIGRGFVEVAGPPARQAAR